jgi:UDP-glucose 4-epimerase
MDRIAAGQPPIIFGDGLQTMDMIDVRDVARANILAAVSPASDVVLNVGTGHETSLFDLACILANAMGRPDLRPVHAAERAVNPVPRRLAEVSDAARLIDFSSNLRLEDGLRQLVDWWTRERSSFLACDAAE